MSADNGDMPRRTAAEEAAETIVGVITDLTEIASRLPVPETETEQVAAILGRLAQEVAESEYLIKARPGERPSRLPAYTRAATAVVADAVASEHDFARWLAGVLCAVAARRGSSAALVAQRPGSWEATHVLRLVRGTAGEHDEHLPSYRDRS